MSEQESLVASATQSPEEKQARWQREREERQLARATTEPQRERMRALFAANRDAWAENRQGKTVVAEFRRYVETCDPEKIGHGLYHFSTMGCGGLNDIAHFNLHGFRSVWNHPALYIEELLRPEVARWPESFRQDPDGYHAFHVYTDAMTSGEVAHAIVKLAAENRNRLLTDWKSKHDAAALAEATRLAEALGMSSSLPSLCASSLRRGCGAASSMSTERTRNAC